MPKVTSASASRAGSKTVSRLAPVKSATAKTSGNGKSKVVATVTVKSAAKGKTVPVLKSASKPVAAAKAPLTAKASPAAKAAAEQAAAEAAAKAAADEAARQKYVDILETMGPDDPRTAKYRRQLTAALF